MAFGRSPDVLAAAAAAALRSGDTGRALDLYNRVLTLLGDAASPERTDVLRHIGTAHRERGETGEAEQWYRRSVEEAETLGYRVGVAHATNWLAVLAVRRGELELAERQFVQSARYAAATGERRLLSMVEQNLGVLSCIRGDLDGGLACYRAALVSCRATDDAERLASVLNNIGVLSADLAHWIEAESSYREAIEVARAAGLHALVDVIELNLTELAAKRRHWTVAAQGSRRAAKRARERQSRWREAEALRLCGMVARAHGDLETSQEELLRASAYAVETEDVLLEARSTRELAETYAAAGRSVQAQDAYARALQRFRQVGAQLEIRDLEVRLAGNAATE